MADERDERREGGDRPNERFDGVDESDVVESLLKTFVPAASRVNRDRIMFAAGEHAAGRSVESTRDPCRPIQTGQGVLRCWQAAALLLGCSTLFLSWSRTPVPSGSSIAEQRDVPDETVPDGLGRESIVEQDIEDEVVRDDGNREPALEDGSQIVAPARSPFATREPRGAAPSVDRGYLAMRRIALTEGIEALPARGAAIASHSSPSAYGRRRGPAFEAHPDRG